MLRIIDRYILKTFFRAYVICFLSLVGLYIVIDAISNLDEFAEAAGSFGEMLLYMGRYYLYRLSLFFDMLAGVITLVAALFTVIWMKRHNELIPLLSAGVSAYRVIFPVVAAAVIVNLGAVANQELIIPRIAEQLQLAPDDPHGANVRQVRPIIDSNGSTFYSSGVADPTEEMVSRITCIVTTGSDVFSITAENAFWVQTGGRQGWLFHNTIEPFPPASRPPFVQVWGAGVVFISSDASFQQMTRHAEWYRFVSTAALWQFAQDPKVLRRRHILVEFHMRITKPLMNIILVFLGLPFALNRYDSNVFLNLGICVLVCAAFFVTIVLSQSLGQQEEGLSPTLAAWLPVILFFVVAIGVFDTIKT